MKKFYTVLSFELTNYFKNKSYMITTIIAAVLFSSLLFLPRIFDMSSILGTSTTEQTPEITITDQTTSDLDTSSDNNASSSIKKSKTYAYFDEGNLFTDSKELDQAFPEVNWILAPSVDEVKNLVESDKAEAGFVIKSYEEYDYYIYNKSMYDSKKNRFESMLSTLYEQQYCKENNLDYNTIHTVFNHSIHSTETVLGKNMAQSYWYCYVFVILVFMIIIFYGIMIATSITTEKSNRSIEVLITSTDANCLLFGKVIAGAIASIFQVGIILGGILISYQINVDAWGHMLDIVLDIPGNVLITFALFGLGGYLFYAFLYGAMGALVSKTEDINKSAGGIQMIIMIVYFIVLFQLQNIDGIAVKIASFLPFSSYSAMFARVAMGTVAQWEVIVSFIILVISNILVGILGAKIYRMGTLRYGNPIKLSNALKSLKQK